MFHLWLTLYWKKTVQIVRRRWKCSDGVRKLHRYGAGCANAFLLPKREGRADETGAALCEGLICSKPFLLLFLAKKSKNNILKCRLFLLKNETCQNVRQKMVKLIAYDISKNKTRRKLADALLVLGMERIQKSLFLGKPPKKQLKKLLNRYKNRIEEEDRLYVLTLTESQIKEMQLYGQEADIDLILGKKKVLVF